MICIVPQSSPLLHALHFSFYKSTHSLYTSSLSSSLRVYFSHSTQIRHLSLSLHTRFLPKSPLSRSNSSPIFLLFTKPDTCCIWRQPALPPLRNQRERGKIDESEQNKTILFFAWLRWKKGIESRFKCLNGGK